jgi:hypothetical protein
MAGLCFVQQTAPPTPEEVQRSEEELLQKLANPLAALASFTTDLEFDYHIGPGEAGHRATLFLQPQIPVHLGDTWNVISRSVFPVVYQENVSPGSGTQLGVGDLTEALYLATVQPGRLGWVWGFGPIVQIPIGSEKLLTYDKFSLGPSMGFVKQEDLFTYGLVAAQFWSIGGSEQRADVNVLSFQPFLTIRSHNLWNLTLQVPSSYDWNARAWTVPVALTVEKLVSFQEVPVTINFGIRYWAEAPQSAPHDFAFQFGLTLIFPK